LQTTCVMDSRSRSLDTLIGRATTDEMCWASFSGWPSTPNGIVSGDTACTGSVWSGTLTTNEPGFGIATRHPEAEARDVWDGTILKSGGNPLRIQGRPPVVIDGCNNVNDRACVALSGFANDPNFSCSGPLSDVQAVADRFGGSAMLGSSMLDFCCATACSGVCSEELQCQASESMPTVPPPQDVDPESWADLRIRSMASCGQNTAMTDSEESQTSSSLAQSQGGGCITALVFLGIFELVG